MRKLGLFALTIGAVTVSAQTGSDQAYLALLVETKAMKMPGMPEMPELPPGVQLPPGVVLPGQAMRTLNVRLWSPSLAPANATASLAVPAGLKQGPKLDLELYRPTPADEKAATEVPGFEPEKNPNFTIKIYWGDSPTVREGQPKIISWKGMTPEQAAEMKKQAKEASQAAGGSYFYKPNWTTGYWPTKKQPGQIAKDASLTGNYTLTTTYTGNVSIDVPEGVNFMDPIDLTAPSMAEEPDLNGALNLQWKPIPNALGIYAMAMGMEGQNTMIIWTSSEEYAQQIMGDMGFMQMADVKAHVADKRFMPGDKTKVSIPAGIFKNADMAMLNMIAYGPGVALDKAQPLPRVQTKSSLNVMLGGKMGG